MEQTLSIFNSWQTLFAEHKDSFIGGEYAYISPAAKTSSYSCRCGPITALELNQTEHDKGKLVVVTAWTVKGSLDAQGNPASEWQQDVPNKARHIFTLEEPVEGSYQMQLSGAPQDSGDGRVSFDTFGGFVLLSPKDGIKLLP